MSYHIWNQNAIIRGAVTISNLYLQAIGLLPTMAVVNVQCIAGAHLHLVENEKKAIAVSSLCM